MDFPDSPVTLYRRTLDLETAISTVQYTAAGVAFQREAFASWPAQTIVVRLTASQPGKLNFRVSLRCAHEGAAAVAGSGKIAFTGRVADSSIRFQAVAIVQATGGITRVEGEGLAVAGADSATLLLTGATNFKNYRDVSAEPEARNEETLRKIAGVPYEALRAAHVGDYQKLFGRVHFDLGSKAAPGSTAPPTDQRIAGFARNGDPGLVALLFQLAGI